MLFNLPTPLYKAISVDPGRDNCSTYNCRNYRFIWNSFNRTICTTAKVTDGRWLADRLAWIAWMETHFPRVNMHTDIHSYVLIVHRTSKCPSIAFKKSFSRVVSSLPITQRPIRERWLRKSEKGGKGPSSVQKAVSWQKAFPNKFLEIIEFESYDILLHIEVYANHETLHGPATTTNLKSSAEGYPIRRP